MTRVTFSSDAKRVAAKIAGLEKQLKEEAKRKTRAFIRRRITKLQSELNFLVNQYQKVPGTNPELTSQPLAQKIAEEQAFGKSRAVNYGDDFHTDFDSPTYKAALVNGGNNYAMRVRDSSLHPDASYEDYRNSFISTLTDKVFAIQDGMGGGYRYYVIEPGSPLLDEVLEGVKIFCSSFTDLAGAGRDDGDPLQDIGLKKGQNKFARDKEKGFTEFTLKEDAIRAIKNKGTDVTELVLNTQHGEYQDAYALARQSKNNAMKRATERAADAMEGRGVSPEAQAVANTNKAISNITVKESESKDEVRFTIQTTIDSKQFVSDEVVHAAKREALVWTTANHPELRTELEEAFAQALMRFNKEA